MKTSKLRSLITYDRNPYSTNEKIISYMVKEKSVIFGNNKHKEK